MVTLVGLTLVKPLAGNCDVTLPGAVRVIPVSWFRFCPVMTRFTLPVPGTGVARLLGATLVNDGGAADPHPQPMGFNEPVNAGYPTFGGTVASGPPVQVHGPAISDPVNHG